MSFYGDGLFEFVSDHERYYFKNAYWALTQTNLWSWLANNTFSNIESLIFSDNINIKMLKSKMFEQDIAHNHSGFTFGYTLQNMKYLSKNGYESFRELWLNNCL